MALQYQKLFSYFGFGFPWLNPSWIFSQNKFNFQKTWYFFIKIVLTYSEKKLFSDQEKLLKLEAEG